MVATADAGHQPSGRIAFAAGDDFDIWVINADGSGLLQLTHNPGPEFDPSWSPDGQRIVYRDSRRGINRDDEIYVMNADGSEQTNLTRNPADDWGPAWSPDGTWIAFSSTRDGLPNTYIMHPDGSNLTRLTSDEGEYPSWSPDSQRIVYASAQGSQYDLFTVNIDGSHRTRLTENAVRDMFPTWAPDARSIAYQTGRDFPPPTEEETQSEIHVMRADGSCDLRLTDNATDDAAPTWSPDSHYIVWEEHAELMMMAADGSGVLRLTSGHFPDWTR
jgi:TolB protein